MPLAEFRTAPNGTQRLDPSTSAWVGAQIGDTLDGGSESQNTLGTNYEVKLNAGAAVFYATAVSVVLTNIQDIVKYQDSSNNWIQVTSPGGTYTAKAVGALLPGGSVSVACGFLGAYRPVPQNI